MAGKRRVILIGEQKLLEESLEYTLRRIESLELTGPWSKDDPVLEWLAVEAPDLIIMTESDAHQAEDLSRLTAKILDQYPDLPIFRVRLELNVLQIYSSYTFPACSEDLLWLIGHLPVLCTCDRPRERKEKR